MNTITVKEFIKNHLIEEIGAIEDKYPFMAICLMSIGIELLGKCLIKDSNWSSNGRKKGEVFFEFTLSKYRTLQKYSKQERQNSQSLYHDLRCGFAHRFMVDGIITLSRGKNDLKNNLIGSKELYEDFKKACEDAINNKGGIIKKNLDKEFSIEDGEITGGTITKITNNK